MEKYLSRRHGSSSFVSVCLRLWSQSPNVCYELHTMGALVLSSTQTLSMYKNSITQTLKQIFVMSRSVMAGHALQFLFSGFHLL